MNATRVLKRPVTEADLNPYVGGDVRLCMGDRRVDDQLVELHVLKEREHVGEGMAPRINSVPVLRGQADAYRLDQLDKVVVFA